MIDPDHTRQLTQARDLAARFESAGEALAETVAVYILREDKPAKDAMVKALRRWHNPTEER